jgi:hypothetical protein
MQEHGSSRQREPQADAFGDVTRQQQRKRRRYPQTETVEAVERAADDTATRQAAHMAEQIPRPVFGMEQVRRPPDGKRRDEKPQSCRVLHSAFALFP